LAGALLAGLLLGITAQFLRQSDGPLLVIGGSTAPWLTIGFVIAVLVTRGSRSFRAAGVLGAETLAIYLFAWLLSYHGLFAVREAVGLWAGWREALPWLVVAAPASLVLGFVAALAHRSGVLGDASLALPIAWSLPEIFENLDRGSYIASVAVPILIVALVPIVAVRRRDVSPATVLLTFVVLGGVGVVLAPIVLNRIHS
jgi:hypothetical protein